MTNLFAEKHLKYVLLILVLKIVLPFFLLFTGKYLSDNVYNILTESIVLLNSAVLYIFFPYYSKLVLGKNIFSWPIWIWIVFPWLMSTIYNYDLNLDLQENLWFSSITGFLIGFSKIFLIVRIFKLDNLPNLRYYKIFAYLLAIGTLLTFFTVFSTPLIIRQSFINLEEWYFYHNIFNSFLHQLPFISFLIMVINSMRKTPRLI